HSVLVYRAAVPVQPEAIAGPEWGTVHARFAEQLRRLEQLAPTKVPIMLLGATGTGKELIAQTVHRLSGRPGAFQAVNCAALPAALVESELFGYRRGAFSGA